MTLCGNAGRMVTHPCINQAHDCLTSVIKHKTFAPCCVSPRLFIIPVIIDVHRHRFEINTLVSEIHENVDPVLGIKNVFQLEGIINSQDCCFKFLNRSLPSFQKYGLFSNLKSRN